MNHSVPCLCATCIIALGALAAGCGRNEAHSYRAPKDNPAVPVVTAPVAPKTLAPQQPGGPVPAGLPLAPASATELTWSAPARWTAKPGNAMRKGSYAVTGEGGAAADLSITTFPGDVGGQTANLNRWRGQLQLAPLSDAELAGSVQHLPQNGLEFTVVEMVNPSSPAPQRILGALLPLEGATWFFKLMGPDQLVAREKAVFLEFLTTVKPSAAPKP